MANTRGEDLRGVRQKLYYEIFDCMESCGDLLSLMSEYKITAKMLRQGAHIDDEISEEHAEIYEKAALAIEKHLSGMGC